MTDIVVIPKNDRPARMTSEPKVLWLKYVEQAKLLAMARTKAKALICELTIKACDIIHGGGGHWQEFKDQYTVTKFAIEAKINQKTLLNWLAIYREVYLVLPEKYWSSFNWTAGDHIRKIQKSSKLGKDTKELYLAYTRRTPSHKATDNILSYCASIHSNLSKLKQKDLENVKKLLRNLVVEADNKLGVHT